MSDTRFNTIRKNIADELRLLRDEIARMTLEADRVEQALDLLIPVGPTTKVPMETSLSLQIGDSGTRFTGWSVAEAVSTVLAEVGHPMRAKELVSTLETNGKVIGGADKVNTLRGTLKRYKDRFINVGSNTWDIVLPNGNEGT